MSSPSRNTRVRKPSHLGSNSQPVPSGTWPASLASMGSTGGLKGRVTRPSTLSRAPLARQVLGRLGHGHPHQAQPLGEVLDPAAHQVLAGLTDHVPPLAVG